MFLAKPARSCVALLMLAALLFCHTATAAQGYFAGPWEAGAPACHHDLESDRDGPQGAVPAPCEYAQAVGDRFQPVVAAAVPAPALAADFGALARRSAPPALRFDAGVAGTSLPLYLLHGRLLN